MSRVVRILGILFVTVAVAVGVGAAQDKPATGQDKKETGPADPISGSWDGSVETPNGTIAFTLILKLDKDKVTGEIGSEQGSTPLTGSWTEGKLKGDFDYNGTPIAMTGTLKEGAFVGEMSFGGSQSVMNWTAKKK